jgi:hypothetical protein
MVYVVSYQESQFGHILEGHGMVNVGIIEDHLVYFMEIWYIFGDLVYFMAIWYNLRQFGIIYGNFVYFTASLVHFRVI